MEVSQEGINLIKRFEGCRLQAYMDAVGIWTIGYGCTTDVEPGQIITLAEAEDRLRQDVKDAEKCVNSAVTVPLSQNEFDALVSFTFNLGCGSLKKSTLLKLLNEGDRDGAAYEFRKWDKAKGTVMPGLSRRRFAEAQMFTQEMTT